MTRWLVLAALGASLFGCRPGGSQGGAEPPAQRGLGDQVGDAAGDTAVLREANAAAGAVVRAAGDCDAVEAALPEARRKLQEAAARVRTATGRASLETLEKQLKAVADACP